MKRRSALTAMFAALAGCGGGGGADAPPAAPAAESPPPLPSPAPTPAPSPAPQNIAGFGDSFMHWLAIGLQALYPDRSVFGGAVGGETSTQVRDRFLAYGDKDRTLVIWAGRNNFRATATVLANIASMVAALPHDRFVVLGVLNSDVASEHRGGADYTTIANLNAALAATYGDRFIDAHAIVMAAATASDAADVANDVPPASLRSDALHLNAGGSALVAAQVQARFDAGGW